MYVSHRHPDTDDFEAYARGVMAASATVDRQKLDALLVHRRAFFKEPLPSLLDSQQALAESANEISRRLNALLQEAVVRLGTQNFEKIFGVAPTDGTNMADTVMLTLFSSPPSNDVPSSPKSEPR